MPFFSNFLLKWKTRNKLKINRWNRKSIKQIYVRHNRDRYIDRILNNRIDSNFHFAQHRSMTTKWINHCFAFVHSNLLNHTAMSYWFHYYYLLHRKTRNTIKSNSFRWYALIVCDVVDVMKNSFKSNHLNGNDESNSKWNIEPKRRLNQRRWQNKTIKNALTKIFYNISINVPAIGFLAGALAVWLILRWQWKYGSAFQWLMKI